MICRTRSELMPSQYNELEKLLWDAVDNRFSYHQAIIYFGMLDLCHYNLIRREPKNEKYKHVDYSEMLNELAKYYKKIRSYEVGK